MAQNDNKINALFTLEGEEIAKLGKSISHDSLQSLVELIEKTKGNIFLTGCGTSAMAANKAVHTLRVVGIGAFFMNPSDAVHGALGAVKKDDVMIFISKGGSTQELTSFVDNVAAKGISIVTITENPDSFLAQHANLVVKVHIDRELDTFNLLATVSTMAVISIFDVVASLVMEDTDYSRKDFLLNHPSGAVGEKLRKETTTHE
ncbi:KpsF/GutQ family sugar-phosphate isomerase [Sporolactobacillus terrae]|uniref:Sugar isomerase n=1 Tax=Sporolactobacillus terrae TaxID=269673 RepID=A0A5K7WU85_9BACL|nr:SIS domain-containing protein [Sporolactobacillus terrae]BBN97887.1 sugar isomerase [Sporolactobacillus terrae]